MLLLPGNLGGGGDWQVTGKMEADLAVFSFLAKFYNYKLPYRSFLKIPRI